MSGTTGIDAIDQNWRQTRHDSTHGPVCQVPNHLKDYSEKEVEMGYLFETHCILICLR